MSVLICGSPSDYVSLTSYLLNYAQLQDNLRPHSGIVDGNAPIDGHLELRTKYYEAIITLKYCALMSEGEVQSSVTDIFENREGIILIPSKDHVNLSDKKIYFPAHKASEEDAIDFRVVVTLQEDEDDWSPQVLTSILEWTLDHGFEHIHIVKSNLMKDCDSRDKEGLPRLMEALQSNMWSTMQRRHSDKSPTPIGEAGTGTAGAGKFSSTEAMTDRLPDPPQPNQGEPDQSMRRGGSPQIPHSAQYPSECESAPAPAAPRSIAATAPTAAPFQEPKPSCDADVRANAAPASMPLEDSEEQELLDKYSDFLSQAKSFHQEVMSGSVGDQERRDKAAAMALQLSQLMELDLDEDSDEN